MLAKLLNNTGGPIYAQCQPRKKTDTGRIVEPGEMLVIDPGLHLIDTKKLAVLKENPQFAVMFKATVPRSKAPNANSHNEGKVMLEVLPGELPDEKPLAKLSDKDAKELIEKTENTDVLIHWKLEAEKDTVRREINARIDFLVKGIEPEAQIGL